LSPTLPRALIVDTVVVAAAVVIAAAAAAAATAVIAAVAAIATVSFVTTTINVTKEGIVERFGKMNGWHVDGLERKGQRSMLAQRQRMRMKKPVREEAR
jgi:uncharacterized cupredoxin-like copper-binding protein